MILDFRVSGKHVIIVGGGKIGERKARAFVRKGAKVAVLSSEFSEGLEELARGGKIQLVQKVLSPDPKYLVRFIKRADVVIAATSDRALNSASLEAGKQVGALVYAADDPSRSDFSFPATTEVGPISIAVSTSGRSPIMAKLLCRKLARHLSEADVQFLELQAYARQLAKASIRNREVRHRFLQKIASDGTLYKLATEGKLELAKEMIRSLVEVEAA